MTAHAPIIIELSDRLGDYWEVVSIPHPLAAVVRRLQRALADLEGTTGRRAYNLTAELTKESLLLQFDCGDFASAELFATMLAQWIGWRKRHGILIGRIGGTRPHA